MSTTDLVTGIQNKLSSFQQEIDRIESGSVDYEKEQHFAMQLLVKNSTLLGVARNNPQSLKNAMLNIAATGLTLNPVSQLAYLVPRKNEVCLDISYKGLIRTATDSGSILWAQAELVYNDDHFSMRSVGEKPDHTYTPFGDRGDFLGCYVVVKTIEGDFLTTVMSKDEIFYIRDNSQAYKAGYGPWKNFESEMIKKTVVKRASKMWPRTNKIHLLEKAVDITHDLEGIDFETERERDERELAEDFPIPAEEREVGEGSYRINCGKHRGKKLEELSIEELEDRAIFLEQKQKGKGITPKYSEVLTSITMYLEKYYTSEDRLEDEALENASPDE